MWRRFLDSPVTRSLTQRRIAHRWNSDGPKTIALTFVDAEGESFKVRGAVGQSLLDIAHDNDIEIEGACGGELACSTCHCIFEPAVYAQLPPVCEEEEDMLDLAWGLTETSRLGCQIIATPELDGITVKIPDETNDLS